MDRFRTVCAAALLAAKKGEAEELLTLALENGTWRTTGYQIK